MHSCQRSQHASRRGSEDSTLAFLHRHKLDNGTETNKQKISNQLSISCPLTNPGCQRQAPSLSYSALRNCYEFSSNPPRYHGCYLECRKAVRSSFVFLAVSSLDLFEINSRKFGGGTERLHSMEVVSPSGDTGFAHTSRMSLVRDRSVTTSVSSPVGNSFLASILSPKTAFDPNCSAITKSFYVGSASSKIKPPPDVEVVLLTI